MRRLVAITQRVDVFTERGERRDALDQRWPNFLAECNLLGFPIPNHPSSAGRIIKAFDPEGLVLTGGNDLAAYGGDAPERDETERYLVDWARRHGRPILAVCRGMQMIADISGVKLVRVTGHAGTRHRISFTDGTMREVNSYHAWSAPLPEGFTSWAVAEDGCVEAIRHDHEAITGILWHPEREMPYHENDIALFRNVFGTAG